MDIATIGTANWGFQMHCWRRRGEDGETDRHDVTFPVCHNQLLALLQSLDEVCCKLHVAAANVGDFHDLRLVPVGIVLPEVVQKAESLPFGWFWHSLMQVF